MSVKVCTGKPTSVGLVHDEPCPVHVDPDGASIPAPIPWVRGLGDGLSLAEQALRYADRAGGDAAALVRAVLAVAEAVEAGRGVRDEQVAAGAQLYFALYYSPAAYGVLADASPGFVEAF